MLAPPRGVEPRLIGRGVWESNRLTLTRAGRTSRCYESSPRAVLRPRLSMARLLWGNGGLPRGVGWNGRVVYTGIWKEAVCGRCRVGRVNVVGGGPGDRAGHRDQQG